MLSCRKERKMEIKAPADEKDHPPVSLVPFDPRPRGSLQTNICFLTLFSTGKLQINCPAVVVWFTECKYITVTDFYFQWTRTLGSHWSCVVCFFKDLWPNNLFELFFFQQQIEFSFFFFLNSGINTGTVKKTKPIKTESRHQEQNRKSLWGLISRHAPVLSLDRWVATSKKKIEEKNQRTLLTRIIKVNEPFDISVILLRKRKKKHI